MGIDVFSVMLFFSNTKQWTDCRNLVIPSVMCCHQNALEHLFHNVFTAIIKGTGIKLSCMFAQYSPNFQNVGTFSLSYNCTFIFFNHLISVYVEVI